jgi:prepilin-type N-terminal cleavage/methylation domain-containing protein
MKPARRRAALRQRGFTLIEILVALALAGLVMLVLSGGIAIALRGFGQIAGATARIDERRLVAFWLRREIESALPPEFGGAARRPFVGTGDALSFLALSADSAGLVVASLALEPGGDRARGSRLVLVRQPGDGGLASRIVLAHDVAGIALSYWGFADGDEAARWHGSWNDPRRLPTLVRIAVAWGRPGEGDPAPLVVRPKAADPEARQP